MLVSDKRVVFDPVPVRNRIFFVFAVGGDENAVLEIADDTVPDRDIVAFEAGDAIAPAGAGDGVPAAVDDYVVRCHDNALGALDNVTRKDNIRGNLLPATALYELLSLEQGDGSGDDYKVEKRLHRVTLFKSTG